MAITTRAGKGSALTHAELDANFTSLGLAHDDSDIALSVDEVVVNGNVSTKLSTIADFDYGANNWRAHGLTIEGGDTAWATMQFKEHTGSTNKTVNDFSNPSINSYISGGTINTPAELGSGKRLLALQGFGTIDNTGAVPYYSQTAIIMASTETQSSTSCGAQITFETSPNGRGSTSSDQRHQTLKLQGNTVLVNGSGSNAGDGILATGGNLILDDDVIIENTLYVKATADFDQNVNMDGDLQVDGTATISTNLNVTGSLDVDGSVTLGDANTDTITVNGVMSIADTAGIKLPNITKATADYLDANGLVPAGGIAFITDGARVNVPIYYEGGDWRYFSDSAVIAS